MDSGATGGEHEHEHEEHAVARRHLAAAARAREDGRQHYECAADRPSASGDVRGEGAGDGGDDGDGQEENDVDDQTKEQPACHGRGHRFAEQRGGGVIGCCSAGHGRLALPLLPRSA